MRVCVLGRCDVGGVGLRYRQAELVGLLAVRRAPVSRATATSLLWPDVAETVARHNLRQTLVALKNGGVGCVVSEGDTLRLAGAEVDLWDLLDRLAGDFEPLDVEELLPGAQADWLYPVREGLARTVVAAALRRGEACLSRDPAASEAFAKMAIRQDFWLESPRALLVRSLLESGERARAEREIEAFEGETGAASRLRDLLRPPSDSPLGGLDFHTLAPSERVRLLTAASAGLGSKGRAALADALAAAPSLAQTDLAAAEAALANLAMEDGDLASAETHARSAFLREKSPRPALALARALIRTDRLDEALAVLDGVDAGDTELEAALGFARAVVLQRRHALPEAERAMRRALRQAQEAGSARLVAKVRHGLASVALWAGRPEAAAREVEAGREELGDGFPLEGAGFELALGRIREAEGRWTEARAAYAHAVDALREVRDPFLLAQGLTHLGDLARRRGAVGEAIKAYQEAVALRRAIGDRLGLATALKGLGQAQGPTGEDALRESLAAYLASGDPLAGAAAHLPLARLLRDAGRREEALAHARRAAERLGRMRAEASGLSTDDTTSPAAARALVAELSASS